MKGSRFKFNRSQLSSLLPDNSIAIIASGKEQIRNRDSYFPFRVNSDFWYLTGFDEPDAVLVIETSAGDYTATLFVRPRDHDQEIWTGRRLGVEDAPDALGLDAAFDTGTFTQRLGTLLEGKEYLFTVFDQKQLGCIIQKYFTMQSGMRNQGSHVHKWHDISVPLHSLRQRKSDEEIAIMRQAAMISSLGHIQMMRSCLPDRYEYQLEAVMCYECTQQGAVQQAYNPIIASGANACILHYNSNNEQMKGGDLVLIDAGCEYQYYASDITRTFPVNGRFSHWQLDLYNLVLTAQQAAIDKCMAGNRYTDIHEAAAGVISQGIADLGLLAHNADEIFTRKLYRQYYMHGTSHWLGLDVHDVGLYSGQGEAMLLERGMVLTVEPGLYIATDDDNAPPEWRGAGIRIEDDIAITDDHPEVLTIAAPKDPDELSAIVGLRSGRRM